MKEPLNGMAQPGTIPRSNTEDIYTWWACSLSLFVSSRCFRKAGVIKLDFVIMDSIPHAYDPGDKGPSIIAGNITVIVLATVAVALRIISRRMQRLPLQADDFLIFLALVSLGPESRYRLNY